MEIRNIIFDLGGVLLNIDYGKTAAAFRALGLDNFDALYSQARQSGLFDAFEKGQTSPDEFRAGLKALLPPAVSTAQIDAAWNAMLLDFPADRVVLLDRLRQRYRTFLLSNTNEIHLAEVSNILQQAHGFSDLSHLFEKTYYSCRMGMRKPDEEIFDSVITQNGLRPSETLFIDDSAQHVVGGQRVGLEARLLKGAITDPAGPLAGLL